MSNKSGVAPLPPGSDDISSIHITFLSVEAAEAAKAHYEGVEGVVFYIEQRDVEGATPGFASGSVSEYWRSKNPIVEAVAALEHESWGNAIMEAFGTMQEKHFALLPMRVLVVIEGMQLLAQCRYDEIGEDCREPRRRSARRKIAAVSIR